MARIVITTLGSSGDLNPFVALALGLRARGHDVCFAVERTLRPTVAGLGFATFPLTGDIAEALAPDARRLFGGSNPLASLRAILYRYILPTLPRRIEELRDACAGADLLLSSSLQPAARAAAELAGVPWATAPLSPASVPSAHLEPFPVPRLLPAEVRAEVNRYSWSVGDALIGRMADGPVNRIRARYGLTPVRHALTTGGLSPLLVAVLCSPAFVPRQPDWAPHVRVTGFPYWDGAADWDEPPELAHFLADGVPVIAVTAGSMALHANARYFAQFYAASLRAIQAADARALIIGAAPDALPARLPPSALAVPFAPFSRVFPRCAAAIHHGGIGTTAQALRAGVPSLVVPWGADQFFTAARLERLGAGRWLRRHAYTPRRATDALDALLHDPPYRAAAGCIADQIRQEDGVATLCDALEDVLGTAPVRGGGAP